MLGRGGGLSGPAGQPEAWHLTAGTELSTCCWLVFDVFTCLCCLPVQQTSGFRLQSWQMIFFYLVGDFGGSEGFGGFGSSLKIKALTGQMCSALRSRTLYGGRDRTKSTATWENHECTRNSKLKDWDLNLSSISEPDPTIRAGPIHSFMYYSSSSLFVVFWQLEILKSGKIWNSENSISLLSAGFV